MADRFDGSTFRRIAPTAFADDRPMSTSGHHRLKNNNIANFERGDRVALPLLTGNISLTDKEGDRPHTSQEWSTILVAPMVAPNRLRAVRVSGLVRVATEDPEPNSDVTYDLRLRAFGRLAEITLEADDRYVPFSIEITNIPNEAQFGRIELWGRGLVGDSGKSDPDVEDDYTWSGYDAIRLGMLPPPPDALYLDAEGPQPAHGSMDLRVTSYRAGTGTADHVRSNSSVEEGFSQVSMMALNPAIESLTGDSSSTVELKYISYAQFKSLLIETGYDGSGLYNNDQLRANIEERGEIAQLHNAIIEEVYLRPRHLCFGHGGVKNNGLSTWPAGYRQNWTYVDSGDAEKELARVQVMIPGPGTVELRAMFIGVRLQQAQFHIPPTSEIPSWEGEWDVSLKLEQWQDGSGLVGVGSKTEPETFSHHATVRRPSRSPFLQQMWWAAFQDEADSSYSWIYREGQLFREDLAFVEERTIVVDPAAGLDTTRPVRAKITAIQTDNETTHRLVLVGFSIVHRPSF